jgi:hypothetical protein
VGGLLGKCGLSGPICITSGAVNHAKGMLAATVERVKSAIVPRKRATTVTLDESLGKLRSFVDEIARREKFIDEAMGLLSQRLKVYGCIGNELDIALKGGDITAVKSALDNLEKRPNHSALVQEQFKQLTRAAIMRIPRDTFLKEHYTEARSSLQAVCEGRLQQAQSQLERVTRDEQQRLNALGEGYDASSSPVVKRVKSRVGQLEGMLSSLEGQTSDGFQMVFVNFAQQLLNP